MSTGTQLGESSVVKTMPQSQSWIVEIPNKWQTWFNLINDVEVQLGIKYEE